LDCFEQLRVHLLSMGYDAAHVDEVLARMRAEEELEARRLATVQDDAQTSTEDS
jgi:hypothetical protein